MADTPLWRTRRYGAHTTIEIALFRDKFVEHKIALTRMESLICVLHLPELNELNELSPVQTRPARQGTSRAGQARFAKPASRYCR
jgi:hypothetical protein